MIGRRLYALALWVGLALQALAWGGGGAAVAATASGARLGLHGEGVTRFVVDLSEQVAFSTSLKSAPYRVMIEIPGLDGAGSGVTKPWGAVNAVRSEAGRIVLDLRKPALVKSSFLIPPRDAMGWRLVVDLVETTGEAFLAEAEGHAPVLKPPAGVKSAGAKTVVADPSAPKSVYVPSATPIPVAEDPAPAQPASPPPARIVMTSPNAAPPAVSSPPPEPITAAPEPVAAAHQAAPQSQARPNMAGRGSTMISAPMPPAPERPQAPERHQAPERPQVTVVPPQPPVQAQPPTPQAQPAALTSAPPPERRAGTAKARDGIPVIAIDPGHGGVDPGATGVSGIYEKHITLAMARELKAVLEKSGRYKVVLTRDRDIFIRLRERVAIARANGADLFISLHADAVQSPQIRGLSVYTLSQNASDNEAQALAEKENKADLIAGVDLSHETPDVAGILIDLAQRETMNRSAGFATELVDEVGQELDLLDNTHRFAGFAVLKAPDVPAVLVEMGYLSNEYEEKQLRQPQYRARLAKALAKAVERFFPPSQKAKRP